MDELVENKVYKELIGTQMFLTGFVGEMIKQTKDSPLSYR